MPEKSLGILFSGDGYDIKRPSMIMGRRVAGAEFLRALFRHGTWDRLCVFAVAHGDLDVLNQLKAAAGLPERSASRPVDGFHLRALPRLLREGPPFSNFFVPGPGFQGIAATRDCVRPGSFALTGVTYTLSTIRAFEALRNNLLCASEPWDTLVAISTAGQVVVEQFLDQTEAYLAERYGMNTPRAFQTRVIPLGVDVDQYRPAGAADRAAARAGLQLAADAPTLLWIGRLTAFGKAHPAPMYLALEQAARELGGQTLHLLWAGACEEDKTLATFKQFQEQARRLCPSVHVHIYPNVDEPLKLRLLAAADLFIAPVDSIQETFGISLVEAMAAGLPIVAPDWDGFRDLVVPGETGRLVESYLVQGSDTPLAETASTGLFPEQMIHAWSSQLTAFHTRQLAEAVAELIRSPQQRHAMGEAARRRAESLFDWRVVIRQYEELWEESTRRRQAATIVPASQRFWAFPAPSSVFACFPSRMIDDEDRVKAGDRSVELLRLVHADEDCRPLAWLLAPLPVLEEMLTQARAGARVADLVQGVRRHAVPAIKARQCIAWLLKFGCLEPVSPTSSKSPKVRTAAADGTAGVNPAARQGASRRTPSVQEVLRSPAHGTGSAFLDHLMYCIAVLRGEALSRFDSDGRWPLVAALPEPAGRGEFESLVKSWFDLVEKYAVQTKMVEPRELVALGTAIHYWPGPVLEIGTYRGVTTCFIAELLNRLGRPDPVYTVELFGQEYRNLLGRREYPGDGYVHSLRQLRADPAFERVVPIVGDSRRLQTFLAGAAPTLVFLDGDHTEAAVSQDLELLGRLPHAHVCLMHDANHQSVLAAACRLRDNGWRFCNFHTGLLNRFGLAGLARDG